MFVQKFDLKLVEPHSTIHTINTKGKHISTDEGGAASVGTYVCASEAGAPFVCMV